MLLSPYPWRCLSGFLVNKPEVFESNGSWRQALVIVIIVYGVKLIYDVVKQEKERGATIIVSTHHKEDLEELCDVILKISAGKIVKETLL